MTVTTTLEAPETITAPARPEKHPIHPKYRPDIDGLRAIAVLSVVIFHAFPSALRGGFIGVDIFFVISGFLISTIIFSTLENRSFSFADFYGRRIRRIFPVLLLVLLSCLAFGWYALLTAEYKQLGLHTATGASFLANFTLWGESGYFDNSAETKPLLHLWSLGIEEQFYILWPALLWFAWKKRFNLLTVAIVVGFTSFLLNIGDVKGDPNAAFYSPQTRFWEMLAGSILAWLNLNRKSLLPRAQMRLDAWLGRVIYKESPPNDGRTLRDTKSIAGITLITLGFWLITKEKAFPGWWALMPVVGTVLLISAGNDAWFNRTVLRNRWLVGIGLISFPLYLWHWPLLTFARIVERATPSATIRGAAVLAAVVLAWLSYVLIEKRIRSGKNDGAKTIVLIVLMLAIGLLGYNVHRRDGMSFRMKDRQEFAAYFENSIPEWQYFNRVGIPEKAHLECEFYDLEQYRAGKDTRIPRTSIAPHCYQRDSSKPHAVMLWGDSHAEFLSYGIRKNLPADWQVLQVASSGCPAEIDAPGPSTTDQCIQSNWFAQKLIAETKPDVVIIGQRGGHSLERFQTLTTKLKSLGVKKVVYTGPSPQWTAELPYLMLTRLWINTPRRTYRGIDEAVMHANQELQAGFKQTDSEVLVDLFNFFCDAKGCLTYLGDDKKTGITSYDYGHLTPVASDYLASNLLADVITGKKKPSRHDE